MADRALKVVALLSLGAVLFMTVSPIDARPDDLVSVTIDRMGAYAVMTMLFVVAFPRYWRLTAIAMILSAGAIELLQYLAPTRHPSAVDAVIKAFGAGIGALAGWLANQLRRHIVARALR
jgi:VanZ family protein